MLATALADISATDVRPGFSRGRLREISAEDGHIVLHAPDEQNPYWMAGDQPVTLREVFAAMPAELHPCIADSQQAQIAECSDRVVEAARTQSVTTGLLALGDLSRLVNERDDCLEQRPHFKAPLRSAIDLNIGGGVRHLTVSRNFDAAAFMGQLQCEDRAPVEPDFLGEGSVRAIRAILVDDLRDLDVLICAAFDAAVQRGGLRVARSEASRFVADEASRRVHFLRHPTPAQRALLTHYGSAMLERMLLGTIAEASCQTQRALATLDAEHAFELAIAALSARCLFLRRAHPIAI